VGLARDVAEEGADQASERSNSSFLGFANVSGGM
jgi:hypothetical protein